ncbi:hypothetical protein HPB48_015189 [Haemaphysalis longicornis]|uniref:ANK_REP_REGION domain-containing protein n=1 Tax=Haemaphysalis longicornis TaxID=44386 RepID=A0A9J6FK74_HAELO|nr:hypothetical protein HPB48_015189 [Haemaphysalis longicornis]
MVTAAHRRHGVSSTRTASVLTLVSLGRSSLRHWTRGCGLRQAASLHTSSWCLAALADAGRRTMGPLSRTWRPPRATPGSSGPAKKQANRGLSHEPPGRPNLAAAPPVEDRRQYCAFFGCAASPTHFRVYPRRMGFSAQHLRLLLDVLVTYLPSLQPGGREIALFRRSRTSTPVSLSRANSFEFCARLGKYRCRPVSSAVFTRCSNAAARANRRRGGACHAPITSLPFLYGEPPCARHVPSTLTRRSCQGTEAYGRRRCFMNPDAVSGCLLPRADDRSGDTWHASLGAPHRHSSILALSADKSPASIEALFMSPVGSEARLNMASQKRSVVLRKGASITPPCSEEKVTAETPSSNRSEDDAIFYGESLLHSADESPTHEEEDPTQEENMSIMSPSLLLYTAAAAHNLPRMCLAIANGTDPNRANTEEGGHYPLYQDIQSGSIMACRILLLNVAKSNNVDDDSRTSLHVSALWGNTAQVCLLLKHRDDQHSEDKGGVIALKTAVDSANPDISTVLRLAKLNEMISLGEFSNPGDNTLIDVVGDFSHMAFNNPERLRRQSSKN